MAIQMFKTESVAAVKNHVVKTEELTQLSQMLDSFGKTLSGRG